MDGGGEGVERVGEDVEEASRPVPSVGAAGTGRGESRAGGAHASRVGCDEGRGAEVEEGRGGGAVEDAVEEAEPGDTSQAIMVWVHHLDRNHE